MQPALAGGQRSLSAAGCGIADPFPYINAARIENLATTSEWNRLRLRQRLLSLVAMPVPRPCALYLDLQGQAEEGTNDNDDAEDENTVQATSRWIWIAIEGGVCGSFLMSTGRAPRL